VLRIPRLTLEVPVYGDTSDLNLDRGAGRIPGTAGLEQSGNIGIAAHRDGFFRKLKDVELGMVIILEHSGRAQRYHITEISIVSPEDGSVLAPTDKPSVTLVTCYPFYFVGSAPQRFIVRGELDETKTHNDDALNRNLQRRET
jgi:sortase A